MRKFLPMLLTFVALRANAVPLPPDLLMEIADIHPGTKNGQPVLYFSSYTVNRGAGPIELRAGAVVNGVQEVYQRVYDSDGSYTDHFAGQFVNQSGTIRFADSADYRLREVNEDNSVGDIVSTQDKVAYCLIDSFQATNPPPGTPSSSYYNTCGNLLGISVGWVDNYYYTLPLQWLPLTGVSSGTYWLQNVIDPLDRFVESDNGNNETHVKVTVTTSFAPEIALLGNGVNISNNDNTPSSADHTDFGYVDVASGTVTRTFTIQNLGNGTLSLTGVPRVKISGSSDFTVVAQPTSPIAASGSLTFQITYDPSGMNSSAVVQIVNNDADEGPFQFSIRGNASTGFVDSDTDGMPDDWETFYNLTDPAGDEDGDGLTNLNEFAAGTSPRDGNSRFAITKIERTGGNSAISWNSVKGRTYKLYALSNPGAPMPWSLVGQYPGTGGLLTSNDNSTGSAARYYRVTVEL